MRTAIITVDVEALMHRSRDEHVKKLIWGDWRDDGSGRAGIIEMMDVADSHEVKISFFIDIAEEDVHGSEIEEAGKYILERGHDLQMHLHPNYLSEETWSEMGLETPSVRPPYFSEDRAEKMIIHQVKRFERIFSRKPISYRGGSFNLNKGAVVGMEKSGVPISTNHSFGSYTKRGLEPLAGLDEKLFRWENGIVELGVGDIGVGDGHRVFTMPMSMDPKDSYPAIINRFAEPTADNAPLVMVLHSWSLLSYSGKKFGGSSESKVKKLSRIIELLKEKYSIKSVEEWWVENHENMAIKTKGFPPRQEI